MTNKNYVQEQIPFRLAGKKQNRLVLLTAMALGVFAAQAITASAMTLMQTEDFINWMKYSDTTNQRSYPENGCQLIALDLIHNATIAGYPIYFAMLRAPNTTIDHAVVATEMHGRWLLWELSTDSRANPRSNVQVTIMNPKNITLTDAQHATHMAVLTKNGVVDPTIIVQFITPSELLSDWNFEP